MSSPFQGKVALITGGSKGIGKATALALSKEGASVVINYASDAATAEALVQELGGSEKCLAIKGDAGSVVDIENMVRQTVEKFGKIDVLIANAGILHMSDLASTTEEDFDTAYRINVKGPYFLCQKAAPHMSSGSHIVLISTNQCSASSVTAPYLLYCSTKGAIEQMTRVMSKDLARKGIMVNCIAPGPTGTDLFYKGKSEAVLKMIGGLSPMNRIGEPEEIADAIIFLSGEKSRWITGQTVRVNGGIS
ncbi:MAG: hypothetical protein MMC33_000888 [Icmadophila ericetorum]|nr:hypothetical protein [Icmadophila ericetorum]